MKSDISAGRTHFIWDVYFMFCLTMFFLLFLFYSGIFLLFSLSLLSSLRPGYVHWVWEIYSRCCSCLTCFVIGFIIFLFFIFFTAGSEVSDCGRLGDLPLCNTYRMLSRTGTVAMKLVWNMMCTQNILRPSPCLLVPREGGDEFLWHGYPCDQIKSSMWWQITKNNK